MTDILFCSAGDSVSTLWPTLERRRLVRVVCTVLWMETSMTDILFCSAGDSVSTLWPTLERRRLVREVEVIGTARENRGTLLSSPHGHVMTVLFTSRAAAVTTSSPPP